jgi:preprotein translocase subunit SecF
MTSSSQPTALPNPRFRITRHRRLAWWGSGLACLLSLVGLVLCWINPDIRAPLRPGLDFTGGTQIQLERACGSNCSGLSASDVQRQLSRLSLPAEAGSTAPSLNAAAVQVLDQGRSLVLRLPDLNPEQATAVVAAVQAQAGPLQDAATSVNTIGPTLGDQLLKGSLISLLVSFAAIALYITVRYDRIFAGLALLCLGHDVM